MKSYKKVDKLAQDGGKEHDKVKPEGIAIRTGNGSDTSSEHDSDGSNVPVVTQSLLGSFKELHSSFDVMLVPLGAAQCLQDNVVVHHVLGGEKKVLQVSPLGRLVRTTVQDIGQLFQIERTVGSLLEQVLVDFGGSILLSILFGHREWTDGSRANRVQCTCTVDKQLSEALHFGARSKVNLRSYCMMIVVLKKTVHVALRMIEKEKAFALTRQRL